MSVDGIAVGIIVNPAAGKDIRRLVSAASPVSDMAKIGIVRRAAIGAIEGGATRLVLADDRHALARRALHGIDRSSGPTGGGGRMGGPSGDEDGARVVVGNLAAVDIEVLDLPLLSSGRDSQRAAARMAEIGVAVVIVLGGDGTHRDVVKGWRRAPMVAISTGTNNVFPRAIEATVAGHAAGLVAGGAVAIDDVADVAAVIDVDILSGDGHARTELGLVDVALTTGAFIGSRAVWEVDTLRELVTAMAEPDAVGLSAIAAAVAPIDRRERTGVHVRFAGPGAPEADAVGTTGLHLRCAIAPGRYADVTVAQHRRLGPDDEVIMAGPGVLSFDGERDVVLGSDDTARVRIAGDGPLVIDVARAMAARPRPTTSREGAIDGR